MLSDVAGRGWLAAAIRLRHDADPAWLSEARQFQVEESGRYVLDIAGGFDHVWQHKFRGTARTAVRKAERSSLDIEVDRSGRLLGVFYDLHEKSMRRWSAMHKNEPLWLTRLRMSWVNPTTPAQLALVAEHFGEACATWVARVEGEPVAAIIVLRSGAYASYWRGAMDKEGATPVRANELLHRLAIEEACRDGYRLYDMGGGAQPGLSGFKEKLGATLFFTHYLLASPPPVLAARRLARHLATKTIGLG